MKPEIPLVLSEMSGRLLNSIAPELTGFHANAVSMMGLMLQMVSEQWDVAASRLVEENEAVRALFRDAAEVLPAGALADRLKVLAETRDADLRISALERGNVDLRAALIDLHAIVEDIEGPAARALEEAIWAELARSVERRRLSHASF